MKAYRVKKKRFSPRLTAPPCIYTSFSSQFMMNVFLSLSMLWVCKNLFHGRIRIRVFVVGIRSVANDCNCYDVHDGLVIWSIVIYMYDAFVLVVSVVYMMTFKKLFGGQKGPTAAPYTLSYDFTFLPRMVGPTNTPHFQIPPQILSIRSCIKNKTKNCLGHDLGHRLLPVDRTRMQNSRLNILDPAFRFGFFRIQNTAAQRVGVQRLETVEDKQQYGHCVKTRATVVFLFSRSSSDRTPSPTGVEPRSPPPSKPSPTHSQGR
jgi:hypothetical protein